MKLKVYILPKINFSNIALCYQSCVIINITAYIKVEAHREKGGNFPGKEFIFCPMTIRK